MIISFFLNIKTFILNMIKKMTKKFTNRIKINHKLFNVKNDFCSRRQTKNRMKIIKF